MIEIQGSFKRAMFAGLSNSERSKIQCLMPECSALEPFDPEIARSERVIIIADLARASEVCQKAEPGQIVFLCDSQQLETHCSTLIKHPVRALLDRTQLGNKTISELLIFSLNGNSWKFEIPAFFERDLISETITSSASRDLFFKKVITLFAERGIDSRDAASLRLVIEELTTNALIHAFEGPEGIRYEPGSFGAMKPKDGVTVDYFLSDGVFVLKVKDSAGSLKPETVRQRLHRQISGEGLLDTSGRGFFLGFSIANLFAINIDPGQSTEIITVCHLSQTGNSLLIRMNQQA